MNLPHQLPAYVYPLLFVEMKLKLSDLSGVSSQGNQEKLYKVESIIVSDCQWQQQLGWSYWLLTAQPLTAGHQIPDHSHKCLYWHIFNQNLWTATPRNDTIDI